MYTRGGHKYLPLPSTHLPLRAMPMDVPNHHVRDFHAYSFSCKGFPDFARPRPLAHFLRSAALSTALYFLALPSDSNACCTTAEYIDPSKKSPPTPRYHSFNILSTSLSLSGSGISDRMLGDNESFVRTASRQRRRCLRKRLVWESMGLWIKRTLSQ